MTDQAIPQSGGPSPLPKVPAMEVPSLRAPDIQLLVQDLAQSRRDLFEERRNTQNRLAEERERSRWEIERIRTEYVVKLKHAESENEALVRAIGRMQSENDRLREENAILRHGKVNGQAEAQAVVPTTPERPNVLSSLSPVRSKTEVPLLMPGVPKGMSPVVPPPQIMGAGPQIISPAGGPV